LAKKRLNHNAIFELIMQCRSSGLSDRQWCMNQGIPQSTFYTWLKKLRDKACYEIPESSNRTDNSSRSLPQDVVQVKIIPDSMPALNAVAELPFTQDALGTDSITIRMAGIEVGIKNSANPHLLADTLKMLRMFLC